VFPEFFGPENPHGGDDAGDQLRRGDIKTRIPSAAARIGDTKIDVSPKL